MLADRTRETDEDKLFHRATVARPPARRPRSGTMSLPGPNEPPPAVGGNGHRQTVEALRRSEELVRRILEAVPAGVVRISQTGAILHANVVAQSILGLAFDEIGNLYVADFRHKTFWEDGSECQVEDYPVSKCLATGQPQPAITLGVMRPDGEISWAIYTALPVFDPETGRPDGAVVTFPEITERKRAEKVLLNLAAAVSAEAGASFFNSLVEHVARSLEADYACVGELLDQPPGRVRTIAVWADGRIVENFEYDLANTPCAEVVGRGLTSHDQAVARKFPRHERLARMDCEGYVGCPMFDAARHPLGLMNVLYRQPIKNLKAAECMLQIFAASAASELQRQRDRAERARLFAEVAAARDRLQLLSKRLVEVQEAERRRLARELHDEIGQELTALRLNLERADSLPAEATRVSIREARARVNQLLKLAREMSLDLRPTMLDDLGLLPALIWQVDRFTQNSHVPVRFLHQDVEGRRFPPEIETAAYRIIQEALTNVVRHARADEATIRLWVNADRLCLQVEDRGVGFDVETASRSGRSSGLSGMQERAALLGGQLAIDSAPGKGTQLTAELPLLERPPAQP